MQVPMPRIIAFRLAMRTSYRDIALLACCQALLLINNAGLIAMNGLVGYALVDNKTFATSARQASSSDRRWRRCPRHYGWRKSAAGADS